MRGYQVVGVDNINNYYPISLKEERLKQCGISLSDKNDSGLLSSSLFQNYNFLRLDLQDREKTAELFYKNKFDRVIHLAAQPGVRLKYQKTL